ncbi:DUF7537 family lipoprotein [Haloarchaeobius sp. TZWSO28]|uniref:DUF7537 family lipoprotein n=1 Tax=Haloarchaeobius sp. TZWSO28 TaxID=3446119 RepID=UPI003EBD8EE8
MGISGCLRLTEAEATARPATSAPGTTTTSTRTGTETATQTETTAGETETTARETETGSGEVTYPPGVSEDGVDERLVMNHRQKVLGSSRTVETEYMGFERRTARFDDGRIHVIGSRAGETYVEDGQSFQRISLGGQTVYGYRSSTRREYRPEALSGEGVLTGLIRGGDFAPTGTQSTNGETLIVIEADEIENQQALQEERYIDRYFRESEFPLTSLSATGLVTQEGIIREMDAYLGGSGDSGPFRVRTTDIGSTTVSTPSWKSTAKEREARFDAKIVEDGSFIEVTQTGGQSIGADFDVEFEIDAYDSQNYFNGQFTGSTSSGTSFYLYKTDDDWYGTKKLGIAKGAKPSIEPTGTWSSGTGLNLHAGPLRIIVTRDVA